MFFIKVCDAFALSALLICDVLNIHECAVDMGRNILWQVYSLERAVQFNHVFITSQGQVNMWR